METIKKIKPVYFYIIGGTLTMIGNRFGETPIVHYSLFSIGLIFCIFGIVKYFKE